jgi:excisionase family DNA binding protein
MTVTAKNQALQDLKKCYSRVTDRLEMPIDLGILDVVVAMNAMNLYTTASCEGHLDHGAAYPWVDVSRKEAEVLAQKIAEAMYEGKREEPETQQMMKQHRHFLLQAECDLVEQLNAFYQHYPFVYDRHLSISRFSNGMPRLESYGGEMQEFRPENERATKLKEYQQEMHAFGDFLKRRFFGEPEEYSVPEAAELLGIKPDTLTHLLMNNRLNAELRGRNYYIKHEDLMAFKNTPRKVGRPRKER